MAEKRMLSKKVTDSDEFISMSSAAQALYTHINQSADDDGFSNQVQLCLWKAHASTDDLKMLLAKQFIISFDSGVIVVRHWKVNNTIQKDRYKETEFVEEKAQLSCDGRGLYTKCIQDGNSLYPQISIDKNRLDKGSIEEDICASPAEPTKPSAPQKHKYGEYKNVLLTDEEYEKLKDEFPNDYEDRIDRLSSYIASKGAKYKNHLATIRNWARKDNQTGANGIRINNTMSEIDDLF